MDVERSSLCNCVVNFLLEEKYLLTAFELLHELLDDGRDALAIRLKSFFSDPSQFPPDLISRFNSLRVLDPQSLLEEKEATKEKLAISEYELRLAQEDILKLKDELQKKTESSTELSESNSDISGNHGPEIQRRKRDGPLSDLGPLKDNERRDLNFAVKEYLLMAGYRLTTMTFYEEVSDQNLDVRLNTPAYIPDALRHYYYQYLSSTNEAAEEKISMLRENDLLKKENESLHNQKDCLLKSKDMADDQVFALTKSLETLQKDLRDRENQVQDLKKSLEHQRKEVNELRAEITSLKMQIEGFHSGRNMVATGANLFPPQSIEKYKDEIVSLQKEIESLKKENRISLHSVNSTNCRPEFKQMEEVEIHEDKAVISHSVDVESEILNHVDAPCTEISGNNSAQPEEVSRQLLISPVNDIMVEDTHILSTQNGQGPTEDSSLLLGLVNQSDEASLNRTGEQTIQILADALPKIVPYVLINNREELLPLIMCAIERHPDSGTRDSLTHNLFNLIKRPDEQQRGIIMDACVNLAKNIGEMRTETELLPQCWEQINHMYEERRLLVAQSCGDLAEFVRPEIRDSLILSIVQQLLEDSATVVREAAAYNLALLLPLFPNIEKYFKVEELMFQLVCDPSGVVVDTTLRMLVPAVINWGNKLDHILEVLLSHMLSSVERCPPLSGVDGSIESHLRVLGEQERWNVDVFLRMLAELLPLVHQKAIETCPFSSLSVSVGTLFPSSMFQLYAGGHVEWPAFEWMHLDCFHHLIHVARLLPQKEDSLRTRITKFLLDVSERYGDFYLTHIMLPVFLVAVGDNADLTFLPAAIQSRIKALRPRTYVAEKLGIMCVMPLLLAGVLGAPSKHEQLAEYLRKLLRQSTMEGQSTMRSTEIADAVRFLCTFEEHHVMIFNILWEMVVSSSTSMKVNAANLLKAIVAYIDAKIASTHVLPALVTLGSDQNLNVKYASIEAFGAVAQHFKNEMIVDKIRIQMDAFLEDGSHEATVAVVRALLVAVPHTTDGLRNYLLSKIFQLTTSPTSSSDIIQRCERANAFCEAIRALDATDLPANSVRDFLLPAIQNLLKDSDAIDPAHKEALEIIMKERSGGTFDAISKVMGAHLGLPSSVSNFFGGDGGLLAKKENADLLSEPGDSPKSLLQPPAEDTRFKRIMRGNFTDMLRGKTTSTEENH